tara:strand:- start:459 stop:662 length:204 start_codon:yes stop_codon:yes gene_type:complete
MFKKWWKMLLKKIWNFFKPKIQEEEAPSDEPVDNVIDFREFLGYRLKFNPEKNMYQKVLECENKEID